MFLAIESVLLFENSLAIWCTRHSVVCLALCDLPLGRVSLYVMLYYVILSPRFFVVGRMLCYVVPVGGQYSENNFVHF